MSSLLGVLVRNLEFASMAPKIDMRIQLPRASLPVAAAFAGIMAFSQTAAAWNVLKNPDFAFGATTGWNLSGASGGFAGGESMFGSPGGGSLRLQSYNNATSHADQCVDISKWFVIDFSLRKFNDGESGTGTHPFTLQVFDAANCGGNVLSTISLVEAGTAEDGNPATGWVEVSALGTPLPSGAVSAKVNLDAIAGPSGVSYYLLDNVQVVPPDEIFPNDLEPN